MTGRARASGSNGQPRSAKVSALPLILAGAFNARGVLAAYTGRQQERLAMLRQAREIALEHDLESLGSIYFNLSDAEFFRDQYDGALAYLEQGLALSRRRGNRLGEWATLAETTFPLFMLGRWDEALERAREIPEDRLQETTTLSLLESVTQIRIARGDVAEARRVLGLYPETSTDVQERVVRSRCASRRAARGGAARGGLAAALACLENQAGTTPAAIFSNQQGKQAFTIAVETMVALGRRAEAVEWMARYDAVPPGVRPPFVRAHAERLRALLDGDASGFARAAAAFDELRIPFWAAVARLEEAELVEPRRGAGAAACVGSCGVRAAWCAALARPRRRRARGRRRSGLAHQLLRRGVDRFPDVRLAGQSVCDARPEDGGQLGLLLAAPQVLRGRSDRRAECNMSANSLRRVEMSSLSACSSR